MARERFVPKYVLQISQEIHLSSLLMCFIIVHSPLALKLQISHFTLCSCLRVLLYFHLALIALHYPVLILFSRIIRQFFGGISCLFCGVLHGHNGLTNGHPKSRKLSGAFFKRNYWDQHHLNHHLKTKLNAYVDSDQCPLQCNVSSERWECLIHLD